MLVIVLLVGVNKAFLRAISFKMQAADREIGESWAIMFPYEVEKLQRTKRPVPAADKEYWCTTIATAATNS